MPAIRFSTRHYNAYRPFRGLNGHERGTLQGTVLRTAGYGAGWYEKVQGFRLFKGAHRPVRCTVYLFIFLSLSLLSMRPVTHRGTGHTV